MAHTTESFELADHGSICVLTPLDQEGRDWIDEHIGEDAQYWGNGVVIEPRYVAPILEGILNAGLEVIS